MREGVCRRFEGITSSIPSLSSQGREGYYERNDRMQCDYDRKGRVRGWNEEESVRVPDWEDLEQKTTLALVRKPWGSKIISRNQEGLSSSVLISDLRVPTRPTQILSILKPSFGKVVSWSSSEWRKLAENVSLAPLDQCKETSGRKWDVKVCIATQDPFGAEIAEFENAKLFMARCYEVLTTISTRNMYLRMVTASLDTGAGSNLIRKNALSTMWLENV